MKKLMSLGCIVALISSLLSSVSQAKSYDITQGPIIFTGDSYYLYVAQGEEETDSYPLTGDTYTNITIYGNSVATANSITINTGDAFGGTTVPVSITLSNVVIHTDSESPVSLTYNSVVNLFLFPGTSNEVKSTSVYSPGIKVSAFDGDAELTIKGSGILVVEGGESSAGIGGNHEGDGSIITIDDQATVIARGGMGGAGIGGGQAKSSRVITIKSNAVVFAHGGNGGQNSEKTVTLGGAAGIGGGGWSIDNGTTNSGGAGGTITLTGNARVTAQAGEGAAGIGGGEEGEGGAISIGRSNKVSAVSDGTRLAIDDDDMSLEGDGYVLLANYLNLKSAGSTTQLRQYRYTTKWTWVTLTNVSPTIAYQSIALSLSQAGNCRVYNNNIIQYNQNGYTFSIPATGLYIFTNLTSYNSVSVTLDMNGGDGGTPEVIATLNDPMPEAEAPTNSLSYLTFGGYFLEDNVTQYYTAEMASARVCDRTEDFTLYAKWLDNRVFNGTYDWYTNQVSPYTISTSAQLIGLAALVNSSAPGLPRDTFSGKRVNLASNINLSGIAWTPIGNYSVNSANIFQGTFNGGNKTISGLAVLTNASTHQGLFGYLGNTATISNLTVSANLTAVDYVAAIAGYNQGGSIIGCSASGTIKGTNYVGGIAGSSSGIIRGCSSGVFVEGTDYVGGIAGALLTGGSLQNCSATGSATGLWNDTYVGGIVGQNFGLLQNCSVSAQVTGLGSLAYVGGLAGRNEGPIENGVMLGSITFGSSERVGALVGENSYAGSLVNSGFLNTSGPSSALGQLSGSYSSLFSFTNTTGMLTATDGTSLGYGTQLHLALNKWVYANNGSGQLLWWSTSTNSYPTLTTNRPPFTLSTAVAVPFDWLAQHYPLESQSAYESLVVSNGLNNLPVWQSYIAGLAPTNANSLVTASISITNGTPYITWTPNMSGRIYTVQGKTNLTAASWGVTNSASRFFKVNVGMP